ncbi:dienelactone hydrolase family protein [Roseomonas sp. HF4]|uniref:dienelactone hydrolase family protein n=1 Tax=Roseomonas sp. HF4 TaxID=2562313 RepID=UPI0010C0A77A|nr:hypothetical protein [Roseomonas sp. HF4]
MRACLRGPAILLVVLLAAMPAPARILLEHLGLASMIEDGSGRAVGLLTTPPGATDGAAPHAAVLIVHDSLGQDGRSARYVEQLVGAGLAVLEIAAEPGEADAGLVVRAYAALARHPTIDPARIGLLAFGEGARVALAATLDEDPFAARVVLYPGCAALLRDLPGRAAPSHGRLLLMHGLEDAANTEADCTALAARLPGAVPSRLRSLRDATYAWDFPSADPQAPWLHPAPGGEGRVRVQPWPALAEVTAAEAAAFLAAMARPRGMPAGAPAVGMR